MLANTLNIPVQLMTGFVVQGHTYKNSIVMSLFVQTVSLWPFSSQPRDFSQPNSSWSPEMRTVYDHYNALCDTDTDNCEGQKRPWRKLPSYNRSIKYATGKRLICIWIVTVISKINGVIMQFSVKANVSLFLPRRRRTPQQTDPGQSSAFHEKC